MKDQFMRIVDENVKKRIHGVYGRIHFAYKVIALSKEISTKIFSFVFLLGLKMSQS
jgi:hypothetical protein